jgi:hypothetical protein
VTDISTTTITWDLLHHIGIGGGELVGLLHRHRRGLHIRGHFVGGHHIQMCAGLTRTGGKQTSQQDNRQNNKEEFTIRNCCHFFPNMTWMDVVIHPRR